MIFFNNHLVVQCIKRKKIMKNAHHYSLKRKSTYSNNLFSLANSQNPKGHDFTIMKTLEN